MEVRFLWLQQKVKDKVLEMRKVKGTENPADVLTKGKAFKDSSELLKVVGARFPMRSAECVGPCR